MTDSFNALKDGKKRVDRDCPHTHTVQLHQVAIDEKERNALLTTYMSSLYGNIDKVLMYIQHATVKWVVKAPRLYMELWVINARVDKRIWKTTLTRLSKRLLYLMETYRSSSDKTPWKYMLLPVDLPRALPSPGTLIRPEHVNGGFTILSDHPPTVHVYRKQELSKVVLHESFHHLQGYLRWSSADVKRLYGVLGVDATVDTTSHTVVTRIEPNEAVVELWALVHQCMFVSMETSIPFTELLQSELRWSLEMSVKLRRYQLLSGLSRQWQEDTHLFSYIFLKTLLLNHLCKNINSGLFPLHYKPSQLIASFQKMWPSFLTLLEKQKQANEVPFAFTILGNF